MEIYSLEAEKSCRWEGISTRGFRLGDPGGGSMRSYGMLMLLAAMEYRNLTARRPCSHNEGDLHLKSQCTLGDCLRSHWCYRKKSGNKELA